MDLWSLLEDVIDRKDWQNLQKSINSVRYRTTSTDPSLYIPVNGPAPVPAFSLTQFPMFVNYHMDFRHITSDYHLVKELVNFSNICTMFNMPALEMAPNLTSAIGGQNMGRYNVLVFDYLKASPECPPIVNGRREIFQADSFCNLVHYRDYLYGVIMFPSHYNVTFIFNEFVLSKEALQKEAQELKLTPRIHIYGSGRTKYFCNKQLLLLEFIPSPVPGSPGRISIQNPSGSRQSLDMPVMSGGVPSTEQQGRNGHSSRSASVAAAQGENGSNGEMRQQQNRQTGQHSEYTGGSNKFN